MGLDGLALREILSATSAAWATFLVICLLVWRMWNGAPQWLDRWLEWQKIKNAKKAADWDRLRDEIIRLSEGEQRCRQELADVTRRLAILEGYEIGRGRADQEAARIVAVERLGKKE
jgi:hypothetical protein